MAAFDDELDLLDECLDLLGDAAITIRRNRPSGAIDPATLTRAVDAGAVSVTVAAVREDDRHERFNDKVTRVRVWSCHAADVPFRVARGGLVTEDGQDWKIAMATLARDGRDWVITGERSD